MSKWDEAIHNTCINTIRFLSVDAVEKANSGHPGLPMGAAPMAYVLWQRHLKHNPGDPDWPDRDRFVLSAGHGSMLLYSLLHLSGYDVSLDQIRNFRRWGSKTPGHPESFETPGVECTSGPLGQGFGNAVGMAVAERALANYFNRPGYDIIDHYTYCLCSDGDIMEGISHEAASLAGHLKLGKLVFLYDSNDVTLDGPADMTFSEDVAKRFKSYGWQVIRVEEGDSNLAAIHRAIGRAKRNTEQPTLIEIRTTIGFGAPTKAGTSKSHGSPLGEEEVLGAKKALGWDCGEKFCIPEDALKEFRKAVSCGKRAQKKWQKLLDGYAEEYPRLAGEFKQRIAGELPEGWDAGLPSWEANEPEATRSVSGKVLNVIAERVPSFIGGDADLSGSTKTTLTKEEDFDGQSGGGRNVHFGVREHAMAAMANGMAYHGGVRPFAATFFVFSDYMRPSVRLAALSRLPVIYVWTHDSIGVGEDGPTHQPVEQLMSFRVMPNITMIRPCDANETVEAWKYAVCCRKNPVGLVLTRQKLPTLDRAGYAPAEGLWKGAYVLSDCEGEPEAIIIATGSEVHPALEAQRILSAGGRRVRVVSMPSWEIFRRQDGEYRDSVLPPQVTARVSVEAGTVTGWREWIGDKGEAVGMETFGASAPGVVNMEKFGFTGENIAGVVKGLM